MAIGVNHIAAPGVVGQPLGKSRAQRVAMDITGKLQDIGIIFNQHALEPALK